MYHKRIVRHIANHLVPTEANGFIPHLLKQRAMWAMLGVGVGLLAFSQILHTTDYLNIAAEVYPSTIVTLTNKDRLAHELKPLSTNPILEKAASLKAQDMVAHQYFAHTSPAGITPWHWFAQAQYTFMYAGENLAINFNESENVEEAWLNSPTHRANVLSPNFTEIGVATAQGLYNGKETTYVVELFGMPAVTKQTATQPTTPTPVAPKSVQSKTVQAEVVAGNVAGESVEAVPSDTLAVLVTKDANDFIEVKNTDETLEEQSVVPIQAAPLPWYERIILNADTYIAIIIQVILIALILAMTGLSMREYEKHHTKHMMYGLVASVFLVMIMFVGRIGVFAETPQSFDSVTVQE